MTQAIRWLCCGLVMTSVGCSMSEGFKLTGKKSDQNPVAKSDTIKAGSPDFTTSNKLKNPVKTRLAYASCHEQTGNLQQAREAYLEVLKKSPKDTEAMLGLARRYSHITGFSLPSHPSPAHIGSSAAATTATATGTERAERAMGRMTAPVRR